VNTWPSELIFLWDGHGYGSNPLVNRQRSVTGYQRQRAKQKNRDDVFNVTLSLTNSQLTTFKTFSKANPDTFIGPYFDCDVAQTGTLRIVGGNYSVAQQPPNYWLVSFTLEVIDRNHAIASDVYDLAIAMGAAFLDLGPITTALEIAVNESDL
jgi:hypothetical protein